jgi:hypothetical protein
VLPSLNCLFEQLFPSQFASIYTPGRYMGDQDESDETTSVGSSSMKLNGSESYSGQVMGKIGEKRRLKGAFREASLPGTFGCSRAERRKSALWDGHASAHSLERRTFHRSPRPHPVGAIRPASRRVFCDHQSSGK